MVKPETARLLKQATESMQATGKLFVKAEKPMEKWNQALKAAIDEGSIPKIELYRPQAEKALEVVDNAISGAKGSLALIKQLESDAEFMAEKFAAVESLTVKVADMQSRLVKLREVATDLDARALKALDKLEESRDAIVADLAELKDRYNDFGKAVDYLEKEAAKWEAAAQKAAEQKKHQALTQARVKFLELDYGQQEIGGNKIRMDAEKLKRRAAKDRDLTNQVQEIIDYTPGLIERCKALGTRGRELMKLKVEVPAAESSTAQNPEYKAMRAEFEALRKKLQQIETSAEALDAETLKQQKNGNEKAMSAARVKYLELGYTQLGIDATKLAAKAKKFKQDWPISPAVKGDLQEIIDYAPTFHDRARELSKRGGELALLKVEAKAKPAPASAGFTKTVVKIIALEIGVAQDGLTKLEKLLNEHERDKWRDQMVKQFNWKADEARKKLAAMEKLPAVKKVMNLIDI